MKLSILLLFVASLAFAQSGTDLVVNTYPEEVTSASHPFTAAMSGYKCSISGPAPWIAGTYTITSVNTANRAILSGNPAGPNGVGTNGGTFACSAVLPTPAPIPIPACMTGWGTLNCGVNSAVISSVQSSEHGAFNICVAHGGVIAYTCTMPTAALAGGYGPFSWFIFVADVPCTVSCTLDIDVNGPISIDIQSAMVSAIFNAGAHIVFFDGKVFRLLI
jgi:hypothetical protein